MNTLLGCFGNTVPIDVGVKTNQMPQFDPTYFTLVSGNIDRCEVAFLTVSLL